MKFVYPVPENSVVTQTYDQHVQRAINNGWCYKPGNCPGGVYYYGGIDWGIPVGTPIRAAADGTCDPRNETGGYGIHVRITHAEGHYTIYGHLSSYSVANLQKVKAGDIIGYSGNTGNSTGPHLHFEDRLDNVPVDPMTYLVAGTPTPDPDPVPPADFVMPVVPELPRARVTDIVTDWLNVRTAPSTSGKVIGRLYAKNEVMVCGTCIDGDNVWFAICGVGINILLIGWSAALWNGEVYLLARG